MTKSELITKIAEAGNTFGTFEDVTIVESAYHACHPDHDKMWTATAYRVNNDEISVVKVYWDFADVDNYNDIDDGGALPWDDESIMSVDDNACRVDNYDLTDDDDITRAANGIEA